MLVLLIKVWKILLHPITSKHQQFDTQYQSSSSDPQLISSWIILSTNQSTAFSHVTVCWPIREQIIKYDDPGSWCQESCYKNVSTSSQPIKVSNIKILLPLKSERYLLHNSRDYYKNHDSTEYSGGVKYIPRDDSN